MMKTILKSFTFLSVFALIYSSNAEAASTRVTLDLPANQTWISKSDTRTGNYSSVYSRLFSVYPNNGGTDNFTRVQVKVTSSTGTAMSDIVTLNETSTSSTSITLKNGTLGHTNIKFQFRGNHPDYSAKADVSYDGR